MSEHDFEPIRGLPGNLPEGESIVWQGSPNWWMLAKQAYHVRAVALYFVAMLTWRTTNAIAGGQPAVAAVETALGVAPLALAAVGILTLFAWMNSRTTVYTITTKRVVLRFGIAIPKAINIPFGIIEGAAIKSLPQGAGDIAMTLKAPNKIALLQLWPHVRPWNLAQPQPTFRAIPSAQSVAEALATAMRAEVPIELTRTPTPVRGAALPLGRPNAAAA
jgi:hypothetical protein